MEMLDEVRARVQAAAERQIQSRAELATEVVEGWKRVAACRDELESANAAFDQGVKDALAVMSADELAEFTGMSKAELHAHRPSRQGGVRKTRRRRATATKGTGTATAEQPATDNPNSSDNA